jgi:hypothetical protein
MMYVGIDVGLTTGYAVIDDKGQIVECGNLRPEDIGTSILIGIAAACMRGRDDIKVAIEYPALVTQGREPGLVAPVMTFQSLFPTARPVQPGTWKQSAAAAEPYPATWHEDKLTAHQKDGIGIARWLRAQETT